MDLIYNQIKLLCSVVGINRIMRRKINKEKENIKYNVLKAETTTFYLVFPETLRGSL